MTFASEYNVNSPNRFDILEKYRDDEENVIQTLQHLIDTSKDAKQKHLLALDSEYYLQQLGNSVAIYDLKSDTDSILYDSSESEIRDSVIKYIKTLETRLNNTKALNSFLVILSLYLTISKILGRNQGKRRVRSN